MILLIVLLDCSALAHRGRIVSGCWCTRVRLVESLASLVQRSKNYVRYYLFLLL